MFAGFSANSTHQLRSVTLRNTILATAIAAVSLPSFKTQAETWNQTAAGTAYSWLTPTNWTPNSFPNAIDASALLNNNILGDQTISLNQSITVGTLTLGDSTGATAYNRFTLNGGTGGSLIFQTTTGNASLIREDNLNNIRDTINANVVINSNLDVAIGNVGGSGFDINGVISGTGGITRKYSGAVGSGTSTSSTLNLTNTANSYSGATVIEHGNVQITGSVLKNTNSALGNSSSAVIIGNVNTPAVATHTNIAQLTIRSADDTSNYTFERDLDFSQGANAATANVWRSVLNFNANGSGGLNTNKLTISGDIIFGGKSSSIIAERRGMTIDITGDIRTVLPTTGSNQSAQTIYWNAVGAGSNTDGVNAGTIRFSDRLRTYTNGQNLTNGTFVIAGNVAATGASSIGTQTVGLGDGNGGNIVTANGHLGVRSVFMETPGTTFARTLTAGGGGNTTFTSGAGFDYYGNTAVGVYNGYQFGGLNTTGVVTFSGALVGTNVNTGSTGKITLGQNIALIAQTGGTVDFTGVISDTPATNHNTRITINQLRNHSQLDTNADGIVDNVGNGSGLANAKVGTATEGTVRLTAANTYEGGTEVLGGKLLANNTAGSATGTGGVTVAASALFGGRGTITPGALALSLEANATLSPGDSMTNNGIGTLTVTGNTVLNSTGSSILQFQMTHNNGIGASAAANLDGAGNLNWTAILAATKNVGTADYLNISGAYTVNSSGLTSVLLSASDTGTFAQGMAWDFVDWGTISSTSAGLYTYDFSALSAELSGLGLLLDTSHFSTHGIIAIAAPEPGKGLLLLLGLLMTFMRRRR